MSVLGENACLQLISVDDTGDSWWVFLLKKRQDQHSSYKGVDRVRTDSPGWQLRERSPAWVSAAPGDRSWAAHRLWPEGSWQSNPYSGGATCLARCKNFKQLNRVTYCFVSLPRRLHCQSQQDTRHSLSI